MKSLLIIICWLWPKVEEGSWEKAEMLRLGFSSQSGGMEGCRVDEPEEDIVPSD